MPKLKRPDGRVVSVSKTGLPYLLARGYTPVDGAAPAPVPVGGRPPVKSKLERMDFAELRTYANSLDGLEIPGTVKKAETLRARIEAHLNETG